MNVRWPALLAALSFLLTTNLSDSIFSDVLGEPQTLAHTVVCLALPKRITYIALAKICMPKLAEQFLQFKEKDEVFVDGTVGAVLSAYAVPIKLKYECPQSSFIQV